MRTFSIYTSLFNDYIILLSLIEFLSKTLSASNYVLLQKQYVRQPRSPSEPVAEPNTEYSPYGCKKHRGDREKTVAPECGNKTANRGAHDHPDPDKCFGCVHRWITTFTIATKAITAHTRFSQNGW